ncbi:ferredoxin [Alkalidesulfovibrio alkalitolerans DSM 16529]|jgi:uncharacterized 2Fe-2S/4Fe-4S cluster protein (DUF4445 family)|uniref:Ferredoxin n=1 Tax=Alkalidesulfovibrio alkalitolerans DSM 16529 TaxID=1121439 RepID=S7UGP8_9BACT|nr:ASKHA domain-containing protein [Alkalidesulfovibrio alkalitolerans]EPR31413.1 ferredoxin [Alkalidesulfovibrio alkalitolerans DSM 16529]
MPQATEVFTIVTNDGRYVTVPVEPGITVAQAMFLHLAGHVKPMCGGAGLCGRCKTRFLKGTPPLDDAERKLLSPEDIDSSDRLACRHVAAPGMIVAQGGPAAPVPAPMPTVEAAALAVDLGTTSLQWSALALDGRELAFGSDLNPQIGAGSEIMSRLALALAGHAPHLRRVVHERLLDLLRLTGYPELLVMAGNPSMTSLLLGLPVEGLARAPYHLDYAGGRLERLGEGLPEAYIPPQFGPFVGGDVAAGVVHLEREVHPAPPWLLADFGTNGEFVLALPDGRLLMASVPMGPALEGVGLSHGCLAGPGAITGFDLTPAGLLPRILPPCPENGPSGISGTGAISLLACLRRAGALDEDGRFMDGPSPLAARVLTTLDRTRGQPALELSGGLRFTASDVEEVLKVKAACNHALASLFEAAACTPRGVTTVHLAGALGSHVHPEDLAELGFLPQTLATACRAAGNTSLAGARLLAMDSAARDHAQSLPERATVLDLTARSDFGRHYLERMRFTYVP